MKITGDIILEQGFRNGSFHRRQTGGFESGLQESSDVFRKESTDEEKNLS